MSKIVIAIVLPCLLLSCFSSPALAQITFTKIVDTNTAIPNGTGNFTQLQQNPSYSNGTVVFTGSSGSTQSGIYAWNNGQLTRVVDNSTPRPSPATGTFGLFNLGSHPTTTGTTTTFIEASGGIYSSTAGTLSVVADFNTPTPNFSPNEFTAFVGKANRAGNTTVFAAQSFNGVSTTRGGIYANTSGSVSLIADQTTAIPSGSGNFAQLSLPTISSADKIAFRGLGSSSQEGIYTSTGGSLSVVVDRTTAVPGGTGTFRSFNSPDIAADGRIAFSAWDTTQDGVYVQQLNGSIIKIADKNTPIPGGTGNFNTIGSISNYSDRVAISGEKIAFYGEGSLRGIYYGNADGTGTLSKLIDSSDTLDGKTILSVAMVNSGFEDSSIAFQVVFNNGSQGIYLANFTPVPEPVHGLFIGAMIIGLKQRIRNRKALRRTGTSV